MYCNEQPSGHAQRLLIIRKWLQPKLTTQAEEHLRIVCQFQIREGTVLKFAGVTMRRFRRGYNLYKLVPFRNNK